MEIEQAYDEAGLTGASNMRLFQMLKVVALLFNGI